MADETKKSIKAVNMEEKSSATPVADRVPNRG